MSKPTLPSRRNKDESRVSRRSMIECNNWGKLADLGHNTRFRLRVVRIYRYLSGDNKALAFYSTRMNAYNKPVVHEDNNVWLIRNENRQNAMESFDNIESKLKEMKIYPDIGVYLELDTPLFIEGTKLVSQQHNAWYADVIIP